MSPSLGDNDFVLVLKWPNMRMRPGDLVVADHPRYKRIVKRISATTYSRIRLAGDNTLNTTSSSRLGWLDKGNVVGRVCWRIAAPAV